MCMCVVFSYVICCGSKFLFVCEGVFIMSCKVGSVGRGKFVFGLCMMRYL